MLKEQIRSYLFYGEGFLTDYSYAIYVSGYNFFECKLNFYVDKEALLMFSLFKNPKTVQNFTWLIFNLIFTFN